MNKPLFPSFATGLGWLVALAACGSPLADPPVPDASGPLPPDASVGGGGAGSSSESSGSAIATTGGATKDLPVKTVLLIPGTAITGDYFDSMKERLAADGFSPRVYEAPDLMTGSLAAEAQAIGVEVQKVLADTGEQRLHIVAECDGGVATRYYLQRLGGDAFVDQAITFVSAHHGTWLSPVGEWVTGWQALADIKPGSTFMNDLASAPFPPGLQLTSIYTCNDEVMVPYETSVVDGAENVLFCDHYLAHLDGFWDSVVYERILATLKGEGDTAPTYY